MLKLNPVTINLNLDLKKMKTIEQNEESIDSSLNNLFSFIKNQVIVHEPEDSGDGDGTTVKEEKVEEQKTQAVEYLNNITGSQWNTGTQQAIDDTLKGVTSTTGSYVEETNTSSLYMWFEDQEMFILWNTGVQGVYPFIKCMTFQSDEKTKRIKFYTSKEIYDTINWNSNTFKDFIEDRNETIVSPTGQTYYIMAACSGEVGAPAWSYNTPWLALSTLNYSESLVETWGGWGFSISASSDDFNIGVSKEDVSGGEKKEPTYEVGGIVTDSSGTTSGGFTTTDKTETEEKEDETTTDKTETEEKEDETTTEEPITLSSIKNQIKSQIKSNYISEFTFCLYTNKASEENPLTQITNKAKDLIDKVIEKYDNDGVAYESFEDLPEEIKELNGTKKLDDFIEELGIDENTSPEEIKEKVEDSAQELVNALNGIETNDPIAKAIMDQVNEEKTNDDDNKSDKKRIGLWKDIYEVLEHSADEGEDIQSIKYSTGLATVIGEYFSKGCMHIAVHLGGSCIAGVGTSLALISVQNIPTGMKKIQDGTKSTDLITQCNSIADGFSEMITNGTMTTLVIGVMAAAPSPIPFVGTGSASSTQHTTVKILIFVAALAAAILTGSAALAAMAVGAIVTSASAEAFNKLIGEIESKMKQKINDVQGELEKYIITEFDEILKNTTDSVREKANKIIETTIEKVEPKIDGLKDWSKNKVDNLAVYAGTKISELKQNNLVNRFGKGNLEKIDDIGKKVKTEVPKKINDLIDENAKKTKEILNSKGKELTEEEASDIIEKTKVINDNFNKIKSTINDKMVSKLNLLIGMLKTISKIISISIGLNAEEIYKKYIGIGSVFNDANDFTAMLLAAATKASILLTMAQPMETTAGSTGTGLLLPIGP